MHPALRLVSENYSGGRGSESNGHRPRAGNGSDRKHTLLIVEDEILIRLGASDFLRESGYRVLEASNASEALSIFAAGEPIELVFSDVNMPGRMNGNTLAEWIAQHFPDVKVLLTAGALTMENGVPLRGQGPFLKKPYLNETLLAQIKRLLMS